MPLISSAEPEELYRYSDAATLIDRELGSESKHVRRALERFRASCTDGAFRVPIADLGSEIQQHAREAEEIDQWVREVGKDFEIADRPIKWAKGIKLGWKILELLAKTLPIIGTVGKIRFVPASGWTVFLKETITRPFSGGYKGLWKVFGPNKLLRDAGMNPRARQIGLKFIERNLKLKRGGPMGHQAKEWLARLFPRENPYKPVAPLKWHWRQMWGLDKTGWSRLNCPGVWTVVVTTGINIYDFGWGKNKHIGIRSRQFVTATVADVSVSLVITLGTLMLVPAVGVGLSILAGMAINVIYEKWLKEHWRNAVDAAGKALQAGWELQNKVLRASLKAAARTSLQMARAASDVFHALGRMAQDAGREIKRRVGQALDSASALARGLRSMLDEAGRAFQPQPALVPAFAAAGNVVVRSTSGWAGDLGNAARAIYDWITGWIRIPIPIPFPRLSPIPLPTLPPTPTPTPTPIPPETGPVVTPAGRADALELAKSKIGEPVNLDNDEWENQCVDLVKYARPDLCDIGFKSGVGSAYKWADKARELKRLGKDIDIRPCTDPPTAGAVLIWPKRDPPQHHGHVAIIESVNADGTVNVIEQNWDNKAKVTRREGIRLHPGMEWIP